MVQLEVTVGSNEEVNRAAAARRQRGAKCGEAWQLGAKHGTVGQTNRGRVTET